MLLVLEVEDQFLQAPSCTKISIYDAEQALRFRIRPVAFIEQCFYRCRLFDLCQKQAAVQNP